MNETEPWVCHCRKCHGVHDAADAVQYVWEFSFGACEVPVVVGVHADPSGHVFTAWPYWHGEPEVAEGFSRTDLYVVSCRPGAGTAASEADLARWASWSSQAAPPRDWLIVDGTTLRSVAETSDALCRRDPPPPERDITGEWMDWPDEPAQRATIRANWSETVRQNQERFRP